MNQKTLIIANVFFILAAFIIGVFLYPALPEQIVSHWDASGAADGTMDKLWGVFLLPVLMVATLCLSILLPKIDPLKNNVQQFRRAYQNFFFWIGLFLFYIFLLSIAWNVGWRFNFTVMLLPALAVLWFMIGSLLGHSKRNWFVGIRTPWTMESDEVWEKTHALGALLFKISAAVTLVGILLPQYLIYFVVVPVVTSALAAVVYSYIEYHKLRRSH